MLCLLCSIGCGNPQKETEQIVVDMMSGVERILIDTDFQSCDFDMITDKIRILNKNCQDKLTPMMDSKEITMEDVERIFKHWQGINRERLQEMYRSAAVSCADDTIDCFLNDPNPNIVEVYRLWRQKTWLKMNVYACASSLLFENEKEGNSLLQETFKKEFLEKLNSDKTKSDLYEAYPDNCEFKEYINTGSLYYD